MPPISWFTIFTGVCTLRFYRFFLYLLGRFLYEPSKPPKAPTILPYHVDVIVPSISCDGSWFRKTLLSASQMGVNQIYVATIESGRKAAQTTQNQLRKTYGIENIQVLSYTGLPNKRKQLTEGLKCIRTEVENGRKTKIVLFLDDHVWVENPALFLKDALAPFETMMRGRPVRAVAVAKEVLRLQKSRFESLSSFYNAGLNLIARCYLERHNGEFSACNALDGGLPVNSGQASLWEASFILDADLDTSFLHEYWSLWPSETPVGPLVSEDDNFLTRRIYETGGTIKFQSTKGCRITTVLGHDGPDPWKRWAQQCNRWSKTTYRSNLMSLKDPRLFLQFPVTTATIYVPLFFNYALLWDPVLLFLCAEASAEQHVDIRYSCFLLLCWILLTKVVKVLPQILRYPADAIMLPWQIWFAYLHSTWKWKAACSLKNIDWGSRKGIENDG
ncbi:hypothetical protein F4604DRAFT_1918628 [Suillus subluteus]|nr:hypothetical protein F4604DRAFT_1918628 [Suillus subluteus]